jgi:NTP pyrophosphatase (non-canonical NTP hydrolase)
MNKMQTQLTSFHYAMNLTVGDAGPPQLRDEDLRANLIEEEARETVEAIRKGDFIEAVDGLCDLLYVVFGAAVTFGLDLEPYFEEVHRTNMAKVGGPIRESDGKRLKPPGWKPPDIEGMLLLEMYRRRGRTQAICVCPHEQCGLIFIHDGKYGDMTCCPHCGKQQMAVVPRPVAYAAERIIKSAQERAGATQTSSPVDPGSGERGESPRTS